MADLIGGHRLFVALRSCLRGVPYGHHLNFWPRSLLVFPRALGAEEGDPDMAQIYFHCSSGQGVVLDRRGAEALDLTETRDYAARFVGSLVAMPNQEDWRNWVLHVSDEHGEEVLLLPFSSVLGRPH
jgi:hypothetical protein